jgi:hypothetical protein
VRERLLRRSVRAQSIEDGEAEAMKESTSNDGSSSTAETMVGPAVPPTDMFRPKASSHTLRQPAPGCRVRLPAARTRHACQLARNRHAGSSEEAARDLADGGVTSHAFDERVGKRRCRATRWREFRW